MDSKDLPGWSHHPGAVGSSGDSRGVSFGIPRLGVRARRTAISRLLFSSTKQGRAGPLRIPIGMDLRADERSRHQRRRCRGAQSRAAARVPPCSARRLSSVLSRPSRDDGSRGPGPLTPLRFRAAAAKIDAILVLARRSREVVMGPGEIDVLIVRRHLAALRESLQVLAARSDVSRGTQRRHRAAAGCGARLQLGAETTSRLTLRPAGGAMSRTTPAPSTSSGALASSIESSWKILNAAGFRNVLVDAIDVDLDVLQQRLGRTERLGQFRSLLRRESRTTSKTAEARLCPPGSARSRM